MKPTKIIIHHEGNNNGFKSCNEWHKHLWNFESELGFYLGYQYYISKDGTVIQARKDTEEGAHCKGYNKNSIGICLQGNFNTEEPKLFQIPALKNLLFKKMEEWGIPAKNIVGHRMLGATSCPGDNLSETEIQELIVRIPALTILQTLIIQLKEFIAGLRLLIRVKLGSGEEDKDERD